ncbi:cupin domain-containing protein [Arthrobacter sp. SX1312]|uniref:cupin domain-containing protein n=1 Tax=Arthrobacter sp. SX1312 TaxID=2058896 RepID=UPI0015E1E108|nr:cupin domain-containing protein [Arthrobacter sp. SX1312]
MMWTTDQVIQMRADRPVYRDTVQDNEIAWIRTGEETGGEYSLLYSDSSAGAGVFPHFHTRYEETFYVLEGSLDIEISGADRQLQPGENATVPLRAVHQWQNTSDRRVQFVVEVRPAYPSFEKWLAVLQNMSSDGMTHADGRPKNISHGALIIVDSDIHLVGRDRAMMPVFHLLARRARRKGIDRQLEERYWHQH